MDEWVRSHVVQGVSADDRVSPNDFYEAARDVGFRITKARLHAYDEDLSAAPRGVSFSDLIIGGTMMLMAKDGAASA